MPRAARWRLIAGWDHITLKDVKRGFQANRARLFPLLPVLQTLLCSVLVLPAAQTNDFLNDTRGGHWLAQTKGLGVWWCESGWKVGQERALPAQPQGKPEPVNIAAARGEFEPVQVILRPDHNAQLLWAEASPLRGKGRGMAVPIPVRIEQVAYVQVTHPTDPTCRPGWYPDPLPPLTFPLALSAGKNQPLWLTFHVPRDAGAGDYRGELKLTTSLGEVRVPLQAHVYDFTLPEETHLKSALGLGTDSINRYQGLEAKHDQEMAFANYLANFAEHRISPYSFYDYAPIDVRFVGDGTNKHAQVDFTRFDQAAARWLDGAHFNTFQLPVRGMGGGTFYSRALGELEGFKEGTPEFARLFRDYLGQVEAHLEQRGWLRKAFVYWFDEPAPKDFDFVVQGMERLNAAAPGLKRMLTVEPEPALLGHVDIWCGLTPKWTPELGE